jgi:hypothetical protein
MGANTSTLGLWRATTRGFKPMKTRPNVDIRIDVAAILKWIVIAAAMFLN